MQRTEQPDFDVVVVGGGASGLSAALTLARARRSVLIVDAGAPRNAAAEGVHGYLGQEGVAPAELLRRGRDEVTRYGGTFERGTVTALRPLPQEQERIRFEVRLEGGRTLQARRVLVSTGLLDELPDVPGVAERWGRDVLHCPYCHGWETRDRPIGILATGPSAVEEALLLRQWSADVTLFLHDQPSPDEEELERLAARGVGVVPGAVDSLVIDDDRLTGVRLRSGEVVPRESVVVTPRPLVRADVLAPLGLQATLQDDGHQVTGGFVATGEAGATEVPGLYVSGNVADPAAEVITAAAAGLRAATAVNVDLVQEDVREAVAERRRSRDVVV